LLPRRGPFFRAQYEIYALKYAGPFTRTGAHLMWYQDLAKIVKINYYIWCIQGTGDIVVVDAGVTPQMTSSPDLMFPGHDRLPAENYPEVAGDLTRLV